MFIREPMKIPPGATTSYSVRYPKGVKPFDTRAEADSFAKEQRVDGWAEVSQVIKIVVDKR